MRVRLIAPLLGRTATFLCAFSHLDCHRVLLRFAGRAATIGDVLVEQVAQALHDFGMLGGDVLLLGAIGGEPGFGALHPPLPAHRHSFQLPSRIANEPLIECETSVCRRGPSAPSSTGRKLMLSSAALA